MPENEGATPLDPDEAEGLIPVHVGNRQQLNEWEQQNIVNALRWLGGRRPRSAVLSYPFLRELHRRMFGETWRWAGEFRQTAKNIGVAPSQIPEQVRNLIDDTSYRLAQVSPATRQIAVQFHHRLVCIHPFANGNGRHARMMTDLLLEEKGETRFTWGRKAMKDAEVTRAAYIAALKQADRGEISPLHRFVES